MRELLSDLSTPATKQLMLEVAQTSGIPGWEAQVREGWYALDVAQATAKGRLMEHVIMQIHRGIPSFDAVLFGSTPNPVVQFVARVPDGRRMLMTYPLFQPKSCRYYECERNLPYSSWI